MACACGERFLALGYEVLRFPTQSKSANNFSMQSSFLAAVAGSAECTVSNIHPITGIVSFVSPPKLRRLPPRLWNLRGGSMK